MNRPKISFGIIVLNGEPFTRYCIRQLYPFAHQIIVVEGASPAASTLATPEGHSSDGTMEAILEFKKHEDPEDKLVIVTAEDDGHPNGFWPGEKDEQSRAYAKRATGDYLWQVDIDEFYGIRKILKKKIIAWIQEYPSISGFSFYWMNFWGGFQYLADGWDYRNMVADMRGIRRVFRWGEHYRYVTHRPPTIVNAEGQDVCRLSWIEADDTARKGIYCFHYGMVFPHQEPTAKINYYRRLWDHYSTVNTWYQESFRTLQSTYHIIHGTRPPSLVDPFSWRTPPTDPSAHRGHRRSTKVHIELRPTEDIESLLSSIKYGFTTCLLDKGYSFINPVSLACPIPILKRKKLSCSPCSFYRAYSETPTR